MTENIYFERSDEKMSEILALNRRLPVRLDWWRRVSRVLGARHEDGLALTRSLASFADKQRVCGNGLLTSELHRKLIVAYPELGIRLIGEHLERRLLLDATLESALYDACIDVVRRADGYVFHAPYVPQILAIRGCERRGSEIWQSDSAARFCASPYGSRDHFSSAKTPFLDTIMILFWRDSAKRARVFDAVSNPNFVWNEGTAHLCDGQYTFRLGRHRTYNRAHIDAVVSASQNWPVEWIYELDDEHVRYIALEGTSPVNVVRSTGTSLDISEEDVRRAEDGIGAFEAKYVDQLKIKINIHTCPLGEASSLGCQNIANDEYGEFMRLLREIERGGFERAGYASEVWYTLIDASKV